MPDNQSPELFGQTPSQTVGPFFHFALPWRGGADLVGASELGARPDLFAPEHDGLPVPPPPVPPDAPSIELGGLVLDGDGLPVADAMIETWQANPAGQYPVGAGEIGGFARAATDETGAWRIRTFRPGAVVGPGGLTHAPHIEIGVLGRGLLKRLVTRAYFSDAPENERDPVLALVPAARRGTLIARHQGGAWRLDIVLQGERETVFFDVQ